MQFRRPLLALLTGLGFITACSGGTMPGSLPAGTLSSARAAQSIGGGGATPTPAPNALQVVAPVDVVPGLVPSVAAVFRLTNPAQCFGPQSGSGSGDEERDNESHQRSASDWNRDREHHHSGSGGSGANGAQYGTPYTPAATTATTFGPFTLTDPCLGQGGSTTGHGHGDHGDNRRHDDASQRRLMNLVTPPPPPQSAAFIVAIDSADPTATMIRIDGPGSYDAATFTYTFGVQRFGGYTFRSGHTYTFALAAPATPAPASTPSPTPKPEGDD